MESPTHLAAAADAAIARFGVPGLAIAVARAGETPRVYAFGADADGRPLAPHTIFPVASISKLATALAALRLVERGALGLDDPLARYLPDAAAAREGVTLRRLLSHTSGLPYDVAAEAAPYAPGLTWERLAEACLRTPLATRPLERVQYSNVGYGLLAILVERLVGARFPTALRTLVLEPLGIEAWLGEEPPRPPARVGGVRGEHAGTDLEPYNSRFWRSLALPWGGLLATAAGALALARAFRSPPPGFLAPELRREATRNQVGDLGGGLAPPLWWPRSPWGLGPELRGAKTPHWAPAEASPDSFGHAGHSGALAWVEPRREVSWAILGALTADSGWLVRGAPAIGAALLAA